jgi:hypothetical protein
VYRYHEGEVEELPTRRNSDGTVSFETDRFSLYALTYTVQTESQPVPVVPSSPTVPNTSDNSHLMMWALAAMLSLLAAIALTWKQKLNLSK